MAGYFLVELEWTDLEGKARSIKEAAGVIAAFDGTFVVSAPEVRVIEGESPVKNMLVILRFPSAERALAWYDSPEYTPLRQLREQSGRTNMIFVEGA